MMRYRAIATDYDGTLATDGVVSVETWHAIAAFRAQGGQVLLVTGREFQDLQTVCPHLKRFDAVIAENGGVVYWPTAGKVELQGSLPTLDFIEHLQQLGVAPVHLGHVIAATWQPHGETVAAAIADWQLNYQVIFNKKAVMILPKGVNKATTLTTVLQAMNVEPQHTVGIGDAENDAALLHFCGLGVAVSNALPTLKAIADYVTTGARGQGVQELLQLILQNQL